MTADDYPHVQRRFYDEYRNWGATAAALHAGALKGNKAFRELLESNLMPGAKRITAPGVNRLEPSSDLEEVRERTKPVPTKNSRRLLLAQAEELKRKWAAANGCSKTPASGAAVTR